jgi:hypothetical protein
MEELVRRCCCWALRLEPEEHLRCLRGDSQKGEEEEEEEEEEQEMMKMMMK